MLGYATKSPAPHIINVIEGLVDENLLIKLGYNIPNGIQGYRYFVNEIEAERLIAENQTNNQT